MKKKIICPSSVRTLFTQCNMTAEAALLDPTDPLNPSSVRRWWGWPSWWRRRTAANRVPAARIWRASRPRRSPERRLPTQVPRSVEFEALGGREPVLDTHLTCFLLGGAAAARRLLPPLIHWNQWGNGGTWHTITRIMHVYREKGYS